MKYGIVFDFSSLVSAYKTPGVFYSLRLSVGCSIPHRVASGKTGSSSESMGDRKVNQNFVWVGNSFDLMDPKKLRLPGSLDLPVTTAALEGPEWSRAGRRVWTHTFP